MERFQVGQVWHGISAALMNALAMKKGTFFQDGQCAALLLFRIGKMLFFVGKGYVFFRIC